MKYPIDIIFCLDTSLCMRDCIDTFRSRALQFFLDLEDALAAASKEVSQVRIKLILFGPQGTTTYIKKTDWLVISNYSGLDNEYFLSSLKYIKCKDCFAQGSNALEALAMAIQSDWIQTEGKSRHMIVMFTNTFAHKLENANHSDPNYPENMPETFEDLTDIWMTPSSGQQSGAKTKLKQPAKRLIVFGPEVYPWPELYESWDQVVYNPSKAGTGLDDVSYEDIINAIVGSV